MVLRIFLPRTWYGVVRQRYQMLLGHLSKLRSMIEKPEAYF
jgi:hypothetical protein